MTTNKQQGCNIFWRMKTTGKQVQMAGNGKLFLKQDSSQRMTHEDDDRKPLQNITGGGGMILLGTSHGLKEATASQMCNSGYLIEYPSYNV